jgi:hypothetical protein
VLQRRDTQGAPLLERGISDSVTKLVPQVAPYVSLPISRLIGTSPISLGADLS